MGSPKSNLAKRFFFACLLVLLNHFVFGQTGKDGTRVISSANTVVNAYTTLQASVSAGSNSIQVASNSLNLSFPSPLNSGDLIFIYQVQGASINISDDPSYGNITNYQNCGNYELAEVSSVSGSTIINITCPLQHDYTASGNVVVARVPRYSTLTINSGASLTCPAWNGFTGGVCVVEVFGTTTINSGGTIDVSGKGFRGGSLLNNNSGYGVLNYRWPGNDYGAEKGESIAGDVTDYDLLGGRNCKGAPANGGGGGNSHNAGGGGGGNAGNVAGYTGTGNPDVSTASWATAWNLESAGFAASTSSGGGKGGYTFSDNNQNALVVGPTNGAWGGDARRENGGRGGRPLDYSTGKIFMGGGGGAGEQNNSKGGAGGSGGGLLYFLSYNDVNGSGQILANGTNGASTIPFNGTDGAGGGGGGGTGLLNTTNAVTGISINANGGNGGSQTVAVFTLEAEGPGGGGGGGYIALSNGAVTRNTNGGINGTTNSGTLTEFPPNGATKGGAGINNASLNAFRIITQPVNLCSSTSTTLTFTTSGTTPPGIIYNWYDQATGGSPVGSGTTFTTPMLTSSKTYYISCCPGSVRVPLQVNVSNSPSASFSSTTVCAGSSTNFSASGSSGITSWNWNFGDGSGTSIQQNPSYTYSSGGNYTVTLTVSNGVCTSTVSQSTNVFNAPVVNYSSSASSTGCGPLTVQFTNSTTNAIGYSWNFGDGTPLSTQTNPSHTYSSAGTYTVILTASGAGSCSNSISHVVSVGPPPTSSFTSNNNICQNDTIFFVNQSTGNGSTITSLSWNFGDGSPPTTSTNPYHIYTSTGVFNVTLTATSALCSDDTVISISVNQAPVAGFTTSAVNGCAPLNVNFTNSTTGSPTYNWNFGDGSPTSSQQNPTHIYSLPGTYNVTLIAIQGSCSDTVVQTNLIQVAISPHSSFSSLPAICLGDSISFNNLSTSGGSPITSNQWDFGDGTPLSTQVNPVHYYSSSGSYNVKLTTTAGTCPDDTTIVINVSPGPVVAFSVSNPIGCGSLLANFVNTTTGSPTYSWNFGDGSPLSNASSPNHNYSSPGLYSVTLIASQGSCSDTLSQANMIQVLNAPLSSFNSTNVCTGDSTHFINLSSGNGNPVTSYSWDFDDGSFSNNISPSHLYALQGTYQVKLTISTSNCTDDTIITVNVNPAPVVIFTSSLNHACDSATVLFTNSSTGATNYSWLFGDGGTSLSSSPTHTYAIAGSYTVLLTATTNNGCSTTRANLNMINIHPTPDAHFTVSSSSICVNDCISFSGLSTQQANSWTWTFNGAVPSAFVTQNPSNICYPIGGNYDVTLTVSNGYCESNHTESSFIHVVDCSTIPKAEFICGDTTLCSNSCIDFVSISSNATSWQWFFPGATPSTSVLEHPNNICYPNPGTYDVKLIAGNPAGHDTIIQSSFIQVNPAPVTPVINQAGDTLTSSAAQNYQWHLNSIPVSGATSQQFIAMLSGDYSVSITDANGCTSTSSSKYVSLTGIDENENDLLYYIYPNPSHDEISVMLSSKIPLNLTLSMYDVLGSRIFSKSISMDSNTETHKFNLSEQASGTNFLRIQSDDWRIIRLVVKH